MSYRPNKRIDLLAVRYPYVAPRPRQEEPVHYGIDWRRAMTWSLGIVFSLACWVALLLFALWVRG